MGSNAPADMSDAEFDALFTQTATPAAQAAIGVSPADMSDQAFDQMFDPKTATKPESNPNPAMGWLEYYGAKWKSGEASVMRGVMGERALRGEVTYEQVKSDASLESLQQLQKEAGNFESRVSQWDLRRWAGTAVESLPFMAEVTKGGAVGAAGGAAAGAGGAAILGQVGPQVGVPEEIVTVPAAAGFGARWGFRSGAFATSAKLMSGQTYLDFLDAGLDPKVARPAAIASGVISGVIESAQLGQLGSVGRREFIQQLSSEGGKMALRKFVAGYLKETGEQVGEEELQQITQLTAQSMAAVVSKNKDAMPTADEWKDQLVQTFIQSTQASAVLVGGSKVAGKVSGMATNVTLEGVSNAIKTKEAIQEARQQALEIKQNIAGGALNARSALVQALETIRQGFEKAAPTEAQVTETQQMTPEQALEQVFAPLFDENGNLVQEARIEPDQLVAGIQQVVANVQELDASQQGPTDAQIAAAETPSIASVMQELNSIPDWPTEADYRFMDTDRVMNTLETGRRLRDAAVAEAVARGPEAVDALLGSPEIVAFDKKAAQIERAVGERHQNVSARAESLAVEGEPTEAEIQASIDEDRRALSAGDAVDIRTAAPISQDPIARMEQYVTRAEHGVHTGVQVKLNFAKLLRLQQEIEYAFPDADIAAAMADAHTRLGDKADLRDAETTKAADIELEKDLKRRASEYGVDIKSLKDALRTGDPKAELEYLDRIRSMKQRVRDSISRAKEDIAIAKAVSGRRLVAAAESQQTGGDINGQGQAEGQIQGEGLLAPQPEIDPTRTLEVQGRTNQVMSEIQIVDNQINTLEKQMIARAADGKTTTQISGRIEKLYDQRDALDEELVQLKYGMIQPEDTAGRDIKIKADKLLALRAKNVNETLKAYRKGLREGELITKADVKNVQNEVVALIRKSGTRLGDQAKFIQKLKNIQTRSQLTKALPEIQARIDALLEADAKREATAQFDRLLKQAKPKKTAKYPEGKFTADIQQTLDQYRTFAKDETAREAALQAYADALAGGKEAPVEVARAARIAQAVDFKNRTSAQIAQDAAELQDLMDSGRDAVMEKMMARKQADAERKAAAIESINGSKPYDETQRADSWWKEQKANLRNFVAANETWRGLMHLISFDDKTHAMQDIADPTKAREEYFRRVGEVQADVSRQFVAIAKSMKRQFGQSAQRKLAQKLAADEHRAPVGEYTDAEGNTKPLVYSRAELRKLWMEFQAAKVDPVIRESFQQGNKFTFREDVADGQMSTEQLVEEVLAPEDIEMAQAQFQIYEDLYNKVLNPYWRERFGMDLPKAEMYSPIRREGYDVDDNKTLLENFMGEGGVKPSSAIKRTGSRLPIAAQSDISALTRHVEQITRFVAYDEFDRQTKALFNDGEVRTLIQKKYGADVLSFIQQHRREITTGQMVVNDKAWKYVDALRRQTATAYVGGKLAAIPKQATAMVTALNEVGPVELARALVDIHAKPVETAKTLNQSATFRRLLMTGADRDLVEVLRNHRNNPITGREGLVGLMMAPVRIGVWYGAATSGLAVYRNALSETGSPETALQRMNVFLTDTQQSGFIEDLSAAQRSGALGKIATMFGGDPYQAARQIVRAASDIVSDPTDTQAYLKALRTYAVFHLTVPVAFQLMANAFDSDDEGEYDLEKLMRAAVFGPWGQIPILGDTINYASVRAYNALTGGDEFAFEPSTPVLSVFLNAAKFFEYAAKSWAEDDGEALLKAVHALAKASPAMPRKIGGGLPWPEIAKWFAPKPEKDEALIGE